MSDAKYSLGLIKGFIIHLSNTQGVHTEIWNAFSVILDELNKKHEEPGIDEEQEVDTLFELKEAFGGDEEKLFKKPRKRMSPEARQAASERMKKMQADRKQRKLEAQQEDIVPSPVGEDDASELEADLDAIKEAETDDTIN